MTRTRTLRRTFALGVSLAMVAAGLFAPGFAATAAAQEPIAAAPLVHYDFSATSGDTVPDSSGNGFDASIKGTRTPDMVQEFGVCFTGVV